MQNIRRPTLTISTEEIRAWRIKCDIDLELDLIRESETGEPFTQKMASLDADARAIYDGSWFTRPDMGRYTWEGKQ